MRLVLASLLLIATFCASPLASATEYQTLEYYVTDLVGVLTYQDQLDIEGVCVQVYESTGAEMAVLVVNSTLPDGVDLFAVNTFEKNGLGQAGKDDGLLILVSTEESAWRIEVGYGLEGILTDAKVGGIGTDYLQPNLTAGYYYEGILSASVVIGQIILDEYPGTPHKSDYPISWLPLKTWQIGAIVVVLVAATVLTRGRILLWIPFLLGRIGGGGKKWGGGRSGGGGAGGKWG